MAIMALPHNLRYIVKLIYNSFAKHVNIHCGVGRLKTCCIIVMNCEGMYEVERVNDPGGSATIHTFSCGQLSFIWM